MATLTFRRPPRTDPPPMAGGVVELHAPPPLPEKVTRGGRSAMMMLPALGGLGSMGMMFAGGSAGGTQMVAGALFGVSSIAMAAGQLTSQGGDRKTKIASERRDYLRHLSQVRRRSRSAAKHQAEALHWSHPEPAGLLSLSRTSRLWERRPPDGDFGTCRIGIGDQRLSLELQLAESKPLEDVELLSAVALRRFMRTHGTVTDLPVALALRSFARVRIEGDPTAARAAVRALVVQATTWHAPTEFRVALCVNGPGAKEWDWTKWLPHVMVLTEQDRAGTLRAVGADLPEVEGLLADEFAGRPWATADSPPLVDRPHVLVIVDGGQPGEDSQLGGTFGLAGVTVLDLSGALPSVPGLAIAQRALRLRITETDVCGVDVDRVGQEVLTRFARPDTLSKAEAVAFARSMAPMRMPAEGETDQPMAVATGLTDLLGVSDARNFDIEHGWRLRAPRERFRVAIGVGVDGQAVELDIKEAAQGGMGPHGLVVGATGSGKSELLRTLVLGLAMTHSPEILNFVLIDFKGGATFSKLDKLPHTSAVITNLADELTLVDRMQDSINGEITRRMEALRAAGDYASLRDYEAARMAGAPLNPLPTLFIVVDEFSELLTAKPDFIELFVMIGRVGRSLGVHLLLASQRLEEGKLRGLDTYLSYRIGLKTFSAAESRIVLGVPDAYELPTAPGNGYLKFDVTGLARFKAAYVSGPAKDTRVVQSGEPVQRPEPVRFSLLPRRVDPRGFAAADPETGPEPEVVETTAQAASLPSMLDLVVDRLENKGVPAHEVWLPPLDLPIALNSLLGPLVPDPQRGLQATAFLGSRRLRVPVGQIDKPFEQARGPLWLDFTGAAGHLAVVGGPQSGKSTVLRSVITSLALTHTPEEVQFYGLDFGGGSLGSLAGLPHVGSVASRLQPELVRRTLGSAIKIMERREEAFANAGVSSYQEWRSRVVDGSLPGDGYGSVFLVIDGWASLKESFEDLEAKITSLAGRGLAYGVHLMIGAARWAEIRNALRDLLGSRLELRLGDPIDSEVLAKVAAQVPQGKPGRGITRDKFHFLSAVPRIDGVDGVEGLPSAVSELVAASAAAWTGPRALPIRMLPTELGPGDVPAADPVHGVLIGVDEDLQELYWDPSLDQHLVIFGDAETGKTALLQHIMRQIDLWAGHREQVIEHAGRVSTSVAKIVAMSPRRGLLDIVNAERAVGAGVTTSEIADFALGCSQVLAARVPDASITLAQIRARSWWSGPDMFVVVDDYELVAATNPLDPLTKLLDSAKDIGLHLIIARSSRGAGRAAYDPAIAKLKEIGTPGLVLSSSPDEGTFYGRARPQTFPVGRGRWVTRRGAEFLAQVLYTPEEEQ